MFDRVLEIGACRHEALASHHFLVEGVFNVRISKVPSQNKPQRINLQALQDESLRNRFVQAFDSTAMTHVDKADSDVNVVCAKVAASFHSAAEQVLPPVVAVPKRPWVSHHTLLLIDQRNSARRSGHRASEVDLNRRIRTSCKADRSHWLEQAIQSGSWKDIQRLYRKRSAKQGRLKTLRGDTVDSSSRAETFAEYLSTVQWGSQSNLTTEDEKPALFEPLDVCCDVPTHVEIKRAVQKFAGGQAHGTDGIPAEFRKTVYSCDGPGARW